MTQVVQSLKNIALFLFGVLMIIVGYRVNDAKAEAEKAKAPELPVKMQEPDAPVKVKAAEVPVNMKAPKIPVKAKTAKVPEKTRDIDKATPKKTETTLEKAKPEKASATKYKKEEPDSANATK